MKIYQIPRPGFGIKLPEKVFPPFFNQKKSSPRFLIEKSLHPLSMALIPHKFWPVPFWALKWSEISFNTSPQLKKFFNLRALNFLGLKQLQYFDGWRKIFNLTLPDVGGGHNAPWVKTAGIRIFEKKNLGSFDLTFPKILLGTFLVNKISPVS